jgi:acyl dehydratase
MLTHELRALIGKTVSYEAPEEIGRAAIRYFALAIGDPNPLYTDPAFARAQGYEDVVAPPTFIVETNQYMTGEPDHDGYIGHSWGIKIPGTRLIRGGHDYEFHGPVYPWHRPLVEWKIMDMMEKRTRSGSRMLLVVSEARYTDQHGWPLAINRETLIFQELT